MYLLQHKLVSKRRRTDWRTKLSFENVEEAKMMYNKLMGMFGLNHMCIIYRIVSLTKLEEQQTWTYSEVC